MHTHNSIKDQPNARGDSANPHFNKKNEKQQPVDR
jgi:hypothetical protein